MTLLIRPASTTTLERAAERNQVPHHLREGLIAYLRSGRPVGCFLEAVLSNDLYRACLRADLESRAALWSIVGFLEACAPIEAWGSAEAYRTWITPRFDNSIMRC